jgi:hypothetical protein
MCGPASDAQIGITDPPDHDSWSDDMFAADPTTALMLAGLDVDRFGEVRVRRADLRHKQRRFRRQARLRKQLA